MSTINLVRLFEEQAEKTPDRVALSSGDQQLSYAELNRRANRLAWHLCELGCGPEATVGLYAERSPELIIGILGILKSGAAYVPLDPAYPRAMLEFILQDAGARLLVVQSEMRERLSCKEAQTIEIDSAAYPAVDPPPRSCSENLAYIIYTSGSSGRRKGVMITNANVTRLLRSTHKIYDFGPQDVWALFHSYAFDFSVWEIWGALAFGGRLVIVPYLVSRSPDAFIELLEREQVTVLNQTPSAFQQLQSFPPRNVSLRYVIFGGEALSGNDIQPWCESLAKTGTAMVNMYGITETTVHVTWYPIPGDIGKGNKVPIGEPLNDLKLHLFDEWMDEVPEGLAGELYVSGAGLARGYLNRPALTAERFVPDPFAEMPGARLYRSGDRARRRSDGTLEYLGRCDEQIKIRGFRIEPGEIEAVIRQWAGVRQVSTLLRENETGDKTLAAYIVVDGTPASISKLKEFIAQYLPAHMIPSAFVFLERLPLTANGKLDRKALPVPDTGSRAEMGSSARPSDGIEEIIAGIWEHVLKLNLVPVESNFFELGGHSLLATQVMARVRDAMQVDLPLSALFEDPTVRGLALQVRHARKLPQFSRKQIFKADQENDFPLSFAQERLWFLDQLQPGTIAYNIPFALRLEGTLDINAMRDAIAGLVHRHTALRTCFPVVSGVPKQKVLQSSQVSIPVVDLTGAHESLAQELSQEEAQRPFNLERGPLWRMALLRLSPVNHIVLLTMHHIACDGWSTGVLVSEFIELYVASREGRQSRLSALDVEYVDFAVWQREWLGDGILLHQLAYWRNQLKDASPLQLPSDRARQGTPSFRGAAWEFKVAPDLMQGLRALSRREGATLFMTLTAAFSVLLARHANQWDISIGTDIANRNRVEIEKLVGFFVNTLVLRTRMDPQESFSQLLHKVREITLAAYENQDVPFERVVEELAPERDISYSPLFRVKLVLQNTPAWDQPNVDITIRPWKRETRTAKFDLTMGIREEEGGLRAALEYATDLFDAPTVEHLADRFQRLLHSLIADPQRPICELSLLSEGEALQFASWNDTGAQIAPRTLTELLTEQMEKRPNAIVAVSGDSLLSYAELNARANCYAERLRAHGVGPETPVGICVRRGLDLLVGILGILKAGAAFVPLDPSYPALRLEFVIKDACVPVVLVHRDLGSSWAFASAVPIYMDDVQTTEHGRTSEDSRANVRNLAYIIYTSGSTGKPKGVMVEHRGLCNVSSAQASAFHVGPDSHVLQFASASFDACVFELILSACHGATLHFIAEETAMSPQAVLDTIETRGITHAVLPPTILSALPVATAPRSLSCVVAAGEALTRRAVESLGGVCEVVNAYGPTEATIWATAFDCGTDLVQKLPIGKPIANCRVYILDAHGQQTPTGVTGELHIGGIGVTRGYIHQPSLTAERFLPDPFAVEPGSRMYRTGDLGKWTSLGNLEFLGRNDFQAKIRGFRIELGEIESVLVQQPGVSQAAVVVNEFHTGEPRIVAYVVARSQGPTAQQLKEALGEYLPDYMIPAAIIFLQELPLTPNAKIDRQALAALQAEMPSSQSYAEPADEIESAIATVWSDVLQVRSIGRHDNFFDLGGQSFLAVKAVARLREMLQVEVAVRNIFDCPVLSDFARLLKAVVREMLPPIVPANRTQKLPLSFAQERLWFLAQVPRASEAYHIFFGLDLQGELDRYALSRALDRLVARHEVLRTRFEYSDGQAWQRVAPEQDGQFALAEFDLCNSADLQAELDGLIQREAQMPFDLTAGPLIRGALIVLQDRHHALLITMHHIVSDGWSRDILRNEITSLYDAFRRNEPDPLPPLPLQYADYALWQRQWMEGKVLQEQASYWQRELAGAPAILDIPADHGRPAQQDYAGGFVPLALTQELTSELRELGRRHGMTLYMVVLAGWGALLSRLSCQQDLIIGTPVANRNRSEIQGLIGFFVNLLPIRLDFSGSPDAAESLARVKARVLEAQQHQDLPFERMVDILQPPRSLAHSPIFQVAFSWQDSDGVPIALPLVDVKLLPAATHRTAKFDLTLSLQESDGRIIGGIEYASSLFEGATVERYCGYLLRLLEGMVKQEQTAMDELPLLGEDEWQQVVYGWNHTRAEYPAKVCVQELFEEQVSRTPHAVAVVYEESRLSYAELNRRANQLAHCLRGVGVAPDTRVGICAERSLELVVALLGVLKAGGAYVPLDPDYPRERLSYMVADSAPIIVLMQKHLRGLFPGWEQRVPMLDLEQGAAVWSTQPEINLDPRRLELSARHLAYVIYTSGSTGKPKGVAVEHRGVANRLDWMQRRYGLTEHDAVLQKTPFSFDVSVWEFFWPLLNGARLVLAQREGHKDAEYLAKTICRERITAVHFVPSMLQAFLEQAGEEEAGARLKRVICSGEALPWRLARQFEKQLPGVELHNLYGPTEATVDVTAWGCGEGAETNGIPIGRPIANTHIYVLDGKGQPVPVGVAGELYIGGVGVARGYLNRAELTAERFVPDGFSKTAGSRLYRTGDVARWRRDGAIEYLGRNDFQVKIRGFRIELEEIEARLQECAGIREAAVVAREDAAGEKRLVAYYTLRDCQDEVGEQPQAGKAAGSAVGELSAVDERATADEQKRTSAQESWTERLRAHLSARLPDYMVPAACVRLEHLPLTANGKLDRKALPAPDTNAYATKRYEAPRGEVETILASIWADVLKRERVGRQDNFFELGGHSLLAIRTIEAMRRHGLAIDVRDIFAAHSLAELAARIGVCSTTIETPPNLIPDATPVITPAMLTMVRLTAEEVDRIVSTVPGGAQNVQDIYPLVPLQQGVLFHHLMSEQADPYVLGTMLSFDSRDRLDAYLRALQFVINRHDILRTSVVWERISEPVQVVWRKATLRVEGVARQDLPAGANVAEQFYNHFSPRRYHMDLRQAPLLSVHTVHDDAEQRWLVMQMLHHFAGDHSTLATMQKEIEAFLRGEADLLPAPVSFRSLIAQARFGITEEEHLAYFRGLLGDVDEPTIPFGLGDVQGDGVSMKEAIRQVDASLSQRLVQLAQKLGVSRASICHVVWAHVLALISARNDIVFGTVVSGRMHGGFGADRAMGPFMNTLPVRIVLGSESAESCIRSTHSRLVELTRHEHASLALVQRCSALPANTPLFSALLNYRHSGEAFDRHSHEAESVWQGIQLIRGEERTNYPLSLSIDDMGNTFVLTAQVNGPIPPGRICELTYTALAQWVDTLYLRPATPVSAIDILPALERQQVVEGWNATKIPYAKDACVQQLFEEQARLRPEAIAIVAEDRAITYGELNRQANRLSHHLRDLGIHPDDRLALCARRGIEMVTGLLAILKAGGAYVPIDPTHPRERIEYYLKDSAPSALLTEEAIAGHLPTAGLPLVHLDRTEAQLAHCPDNDLEPGLVGLNARHLAYVIYTSGSTGAPKGTEVAHGSLINFLQSMQQNPGLTANDRLLAATTVSFDIAGLELLLPLISGGRLIIARTDDTVDGLRLRELLQKHEITVLQATPVTWRILLETGWTPTPDLKMLCGGEALAPDLAGALLRPQETVVPADSCKRPNPRPLDFSLFFFAAASDDSRHQAYQLLRETAQFGDQNGFSAVWIPERHFHPFGGIYPNPSVIGASLAAITRTIKIRAGSVVLPLHDPIRVAEEWATLDNLSGGRVGLSFASGWNANDFVLAPGKFENRREDTLLEIETVRSLWRGDTVTRKNGAGNDVAIRIYPKPVQTELPIWLTSGGTLETFRSAGRIGAGILTHLLGQDLEKLAEKIEAYRSAYREARHPGSGHVTLMLHTFVASTMEEAEKYVRDPFSRYLEQSLDLTKVMAHGVGVPTSLPEKWTEKDRAALLSHAFERYFATSGLMGDENTCYAMLERIAAIDVDEIACLIDFGVEFEATKASLWRLAALRDRWAQAKVASLQEATSKLTAEPRNVLFNMYGPTETTIWSAITRVEPDTDLVGAGKPIANTQLYVLDPQLRPLPLQAEGELYIGGAGVARGYHKRPALTAERFVPDPFGSEPGARMYKTGDLARWSPGGYVEYRGRNDFQLKIRGHRIEPGEIEAALLSDARINQAVVVAQGDAAQRRLVAYITERPSGKQQAEAQAATVQSRTIGPELQRYLRHKLPEYMVPSAIVVLDSFPTTRNGKIDRLALPKPGAPVGATRRAPRTPKEELLCGVFAEVLRVQDIGVDDNFFELGGHSLLAIQLVSRLRQALGWDITVRMLFEAPTVATLAGEIDRQSMALQETLSQIESLSEQEVQLRVRAHQI